jgi:hypothetical protein
LLKLPEDLKTCYKLPVITADEDKKLRKGEVPCSECGIKDRKCRPRRVIWRRLASDKFTASRIGEPYTSMVFGRCFAGEPMCDLCGDVLMACARKALASQGITLETKDGIGESAVGRLNSLVQDTLKDVSKDFGDQTDEENGGNKEEDEDDEEEEDDDNDD